MKQYKWEHDQIDNMEYIAWFGHGSAKLARQAQSKENTLAKMERGGLTNKVARNSVLVYLDFGVDLDSRVALVGTNGTGKSTHLMTGELTPCEGMVMRHNHWRIAQYYQHRTFFDLVDLVDFLQENNSLSRKSIIWRWRPPWTCLTVKYRRVKSCGVAIYAGGTQNRRTPYPSGGHRPKELGKRHTQGTMTSDERSFASTHNSIPEITGLCSPRDHTVRHQPRGSSAQPFPRWWRNSISAHSEPGSSEGGGPEGPDDSEVTPPPLTKEQIEGRLSALRSILKDHNKKNNTDPIQLDFDEEDIAAKDTRIVKGGRLARGWFERLSANGIDQWSDLKEAFAARYSIRRACFKEPHEITKIIRRANESLTTFKERWTVETGFIMGVPKVMKISSFMESLKFPELAKRFSDKASTIVNEMMRRLDDFVRSERAFTQTELPKGKTREHRKSYFPTVRKDDRLFRNNNHITDQ
nr:ABC transporter F family member 1 [Tanacetum cinerariifolium]